MWFILMYAVQSSCIYTSTYNTSCETVYIPNSVTVIPENAFTRNTNLTRVIFEEVSSLHTINEEAFSGILNLISVNLPKSLVTIGEHAFIGSKMTTLTFEKESILTTLGTFAFNGIKVINPVEFPSSLKVFELYSMYSSNFNKVTFEVGSQLTFVGANAFEKAIISNIEFPSSIETIFSQVFLDSTIKQICFQENETALDFIFEYAFIGANVETLIFNRPGNYTFSYFKSLRNLFAIDFITTDLCGDVTGTCNLISWRCTPGRAYKNVYGCKKTNVEWAKDCTITPPSDSKHNELYYLFFIIPGFILLILLFKYL